jgi:formate dehydrogenase major subunit
VVIGDSANDLFGVPLDPNVHIQESKAASCDIRPGRRPRGPALLKLVEDYRRRAGITLETGNERRNDPAGVTGGSFLVRPKDRPGDSEDATS